MFNEKDREFTKNGELPVWQSTKYIAARNKAIEIINGSKYGVVESDFWILMNLTSKKDKMAYNGLIISHNGCLKINDSLGSRFDPECVAFDKDGYGGSLVYTYCNKAQGLYEVGEVNTKNCNNDYPYAMAFKRLFDRVVLKLSKFAYSGIYSDSESDEFMQQLNACDAKPATVVRYVPNVFNDTTVFSADPEVKAMQEEAISLMNGDVALANTASYKRYKCAFLALSKEQLSAVIDTINEHRATA